MYYNRVIKKLSVLKILNLIKKSPVDGCVRNQFFIKILVLQTDTNPFQLNFSVDNQSSIFTCQVFYLKFRHEQVHAFLWTIKFQSGQVNPKSYLPSLATKDCGSVCWTEI